MKYILKIFVAVLSVFVLFLSVFKFRIGLEGVVGRAIAIKDLSKVFCLLIFNSSGGHAVRKDLSICSRGRLCVTTWRTGTRWTGDCVAHGDDV